MVDSISTHQIVIFGVGDIGKDILNRIVYQDMGDEVVCFCDNNPGMWSTKIAEKDVVSPSEACRLYPEAVFFVTVINHTEEVKNQLLNLGVLDRNILIFGKEDPFNEKDRLFLAKRKEDYLNWCSKHNSGIKEFENRFQGKRIFIIGNGSSLTFEDLEKLKGEYSFGCNRLYMLFDKVEWRPTFYCFYDALRVKILKKDIPYIIENCDYLFTVSNLYQEFSEEIIDNPKVNFVHVEKEKYYPELPKFSEDPSKYVYDGQTVMYLATQLAIYMGFTEIYYLGADNHYSVELKNDGTLRKDSSVKDYPAEIGKMELSNSVIPQIELTTMSFEATKKYADEHNIKVFNVTRGGRLEVFERVDFDEVVSK